MTTVAQHPVEASARPHRAPGTAVSVGKALSSSTRAAIFDRLRESDSEFTVRDVAGDFELHPNVARTHLELLADAGLVTVGRRKHPGGGRPAKIYRAREDADVDQGASDASATLRLLVSLLAQLLDGDARMLRERAHEAAVAEGRRLVAASMVGPQRSDLGEAADVAVRALLPCAPEIRVLKTGSGWVDVTGVRGMFEALAAERAEIADLLERGLLTGAMAAAGVRVTLAEAGTTLEGGHVWRMRSTGRAPRRSAVQPDAAVDARGRHRERGVVQAMRAITGLGPGEVLEVLTEGPGSPAAFARWADRAGHQLLGVERASDPAGRPAIRLLIRKGT